VPRCDRRGGVLDEGEPGCPGGHRDEARPTIGAHVCQMFLTRASCNNNNPHFRRHDDDDGANGDGFSTSHKIEFPKYDGMGDPLPWVNHCEQYFHMCRTPDHRRVPLTVIYQLDNTKL
jgi:hypothetical protein